MKKIILAIEQQFNRNVASLGDYPLYTFLHRDDEQNTYILKFSKFLDGNEDIYVLEKQLISFLKVDLLLNILGLGDKYKINCVNNRVYFQLADGLKSINGETACHCSFFFPKRNGWIKKIE